MDFDDPYMAQWIEIDGNALIHNIELFRKAPLLTRLSCSMEHRGDGVDLNPVLSSKTLVGQLRSVTRDESVGYGRTSTGRHSSQLAVIPVGYADGYSHTLDNFRMVLIRRCWAPVVERVCMNVLMADITDIPQDSIEDQVVLIGRQVNAAVPVEKLALLSDSVINENLARLSPAVSRSVV